MKNKNAKLNNELNSEQLSNAAGGLSIGGDLDAGDGGLDLQEISNSIVTSDHTEKSNQETVDVTAKGDFSLT